MSQSMIDPWYRRETDFPAAASPEEQLHFLLNYAILAPSRHNVQPWHFHIEGNTVELSADRSRALPVADPNDREMIISCGAALANLVIAIRYFGYAANVEVDPDSAQRDVLARVSLEKGVPATEEERALFHAIQQRRTNRQVFTKQSVPASLLAALEAIAAEGGTVLQVVQGMQARSAVANLIVIGDHELWNDVHFCQEIAVWTRSAADQSDDGVPEYALGKEDAAASFGPVRIRTLMQSAASSSHGASGAPALVVLWTFSDTWPDWLIAGQVLERLVLHARTQGVWASFFSQPIEIASLRKELCNLFGRTTFPQLVLRLGYGPDIPPTPRRKVRDVLC